MQTTQPSLCGAGCHSLTLGDWKLKLCWCPRDPPERLAQWARGATPDPRAHPESRVYLVLLARRGQRSVLVNDMNSPGLKLGEVNKSDGMDSRFSKLDTEP